MQAKYNDYTYDTFFFLQKLTAKLPRQDGLWLPCVWAIRGSLWAHPAVSADL